MNNKALLIVIILLLAGILAIVALEANEKSPGEQAADNIGELTEEIGDEIDDAQTN